MLLSFSPLFSRVAAVASLTLMISVALTGCVLLAPSEPEPSGPLALTVVDGRVAFVQCFARTLKLSFVNVRVAGRATDASDVKATEVLLARSDADGEGAEVPFGEPIVIGEQLSGLTTEKSQTVDPYTFLGPVTIYVAIAGEGVSADVRFGDIELQSLTPGHFVYDDGTVATEPCGMDGAWEGAASGVEVQGG